MHQPGEYCEYHGKKEQTGHHRWPSATNVGESPAKLVSDDPTGTVGKQ
ncbi:hypothetical protein Rhow_002376 [Rhodococcus wratislaviensis]|uniref:Uncharacterized protein n=1 Tax=Rhodococcus wratislaviensis TaxID=44752 RepID=A0A402C5M8_RHOWR|nr:hypothetical protein Rhow_002376 [Rhodococcus wratislaviensis]